MQITKEQVQKLACGDGFAWFKEKFPQGGDYAEIIQALNADKKYEWARWGVSQAYKAFLQGETKAEFIKAETKATDAMVVELNSMEHPADQVEGESSSGNYARIGSSGNYAQIGSSGNYARIGSSGDDARIGSSGDDARIGSSGYNARIDATGKDVVVAAAGSVSRIVLGEGGCAVVPYSDGTRTRFAIAYVGENGIKANTAYSVSEAGEFVEVE